MVIARAIKKYGVDNFKFEVLLSDLTQEEADKKEIQLIKEKDCLVPNGYNVATGGKNGATGISRYGSENSNAHFSEEEAQYILDNRDKPMIVLYEEFKDRITYDAFKNIYHGITYSNLTTITEEYPNNFEYSCQFNGLKITYQDVASLRQRYANGEYWLDVYQDYKDIYPDKWSFWNLYYGNRCPLVMPEVFTPENKKKHSSLGRRGERNGRSKLTEKDVLEIRELHRQGVSNSEIYKKFPIVSRTNIREIIANKIWTYLL